MDYENSHRKAVVPKNGHVKIQLSHLRQLNFHVIQMDQVSFLGVQFGTVEGGLP